MIKLHLKMTKTAILSQKNDKLSFLTYVLPIKLFQIRLWTLCCEIIIKAWVQSWHMLKIIKYLCYCCKQQFDLNHGFRLEFIHDHLRTKQILFYSAVGNHLCCKHVF